MYSVSDRQSEPGRWAADRGLGWAFAALACSLGRGFSVAAAFVVAVGAGPSARAAPVCAARGCAAASAALVGQAGDVARRPATLDGGLPDTAIWACSPGRPVVTATATPVTADDDAGHGQPPGYSHRQVGAAPDVGVVEPRSSAPPRRDVRPNVEIESLSRRESRQQVQDRPTQATRATGSFLRTAAEPPLPAGTVSAGSRHDRIPAVPADPHRPRRRARGPAPPVLQTGTGPDPATRAASRPSRAPPAGRRARPSEPVRRRPPRRGSAATTDERDAP